MCYGNQAVGYGGGSRYQLYGQKNNSVQQPVPRRNTTIDQMQAAKEMCGPKGVKSYSEGNNSGGGVDVTTKGGGIHGESGNGIRVDCN